MMKFLRILAIAVIFTAGSMVITGCDFEAETPAEIDDDVGEIDIDARDRAYAKKKAERDRKRKDRKDRAEKVKRPAQVDLDVTRKPIKRVPAPAPLPRVERRAKKVVAEQTDQKDKIDKYIRHHSFNVGEIELEY